MGQTNFQVPISEREEKKYMKNIVLREMRINCRLIFIILAFLDG